MPSGSEFTQALFLDNDSTQLSLVRQMLPRIETIKIAESAHPPSVPLSEIQRYFEEASGQSFSGSLYIERAYRVRKRPHHTFDQVSGIQSQHFQQIYDWILRTATAKHRALLIDWDRTLTYFEGYLADDEGPIVGDIDLYYEHGLEFLFGGTARLSMIRTILEYAAAKQIQLFIVTNNGGCNDPRSGFNNYVAKFFGSIPYTLVCGRDFGGHKGRALASDPRFIRLQAAPSGGGRRSRRCRLCHRRRTIRVSRRKST
jgi:hypothetical protein